MENIENTKATLLKYLAYKCYKKQEKDLADDERYYCSSLAEWQAYVYHVVPEDHSEYTIFDFTGYAIKKDKSLEQTISPSIVLTAKDQICNYCWNMQWEEIQEKKVELDKHNLAAYLRKKSVMMDRLENGENVVIFGTSEKPIGRTMIASIIMKEAIRLRVTHRKRCHTYDWIDFSTLVQAVESKSNDLADYRSCDWLVVDNIQRKNRTARQITFISDLIDPFFIDRYRNKQPTILVFKFDVRDKSLLMEQLFGVGINRIMESKKTCKIPLSRNLSI